MRQQLFLIWTVVITIIGREEKILLRELFRKKV